MSSLQRYKKPGGFVQLLSLFETFGPQKKEKFLEMIESESAIWAQALRDKMLTLERIFRWPDQVCIEVFKNLPPKQLALALQGLKDEQKVRMLTFFSASERRKLEDMLVELSPKPEDISSNMVKVVELTRKMLQQGELRPEKFDELLMIPEDFENKLESQTLGATQAAAAPPATMPKGSAATTNGSGASANEAHSSQGVIPTDVLQLQRALAVALKENKALKEEVRILREKLLTIRKIS